MKYYKFIELDWHSTRESMKKYIVKNPRLLASFINGAWVDCNLQEILEKVPEMPSMFATVGLTIKRVSLFVMHYSVGLIHVDDDVMHPYRINFPIMNCENTETKYFTVSSQPIKGAQPNKISYYGFTPDQCEFVDSFELNRPAIIKTQEPHQVVVHHKNFPRVSCTVAFHEDLTDLWNRID